MGKTFSQVSCNQQGYGTHREDQEEQACRQQHVRTGDMTKQPMDPTSEDQGRLEEVY